MIFNTISDSAIISELCCRIKETRMQLGLSQIELAEHTRVGTATIKRAELGESATLSTLIGILRGLERLHQLESILSDSHMRTFNAQFTASSPARIHIKKNRAVSHPRRVLLKVNPSARPAQPLMSGTPLLKCEAWFGQIWQRTPNPDERVKST